MTSSTQEVIDKILTEHELLGTSRFMGQIDLGGMPTHLVDDSIELLATEVAPRHPQGNATAESVLEAPLSSVCRWTQPS
ncbi:hypothetical protein OG259_06875 [Streptomyces sp. NBC_00250]|uniref:hypothetical protein n=1 Tax=Streptomyces sp. NBC_00250 TaxID=2903641 RepID=UPI002E27B662|nr:hypothetical protein [Streptomyces sp. NBC_00250]